MPHFKKYAYRYKILSILSLLILPSTSLCTSLQAKTLPQLTSTCFTYNIGQENSAPHSIKEKKFTAELVGTGLKLEIGQVDFSDDNQILKSDSLERINAAAAYGLLSAAFHGISPNCTGQPLPELDEIKHSRPNAQWRSVIFTKKNFEPFLIQNIHLSVPSTSPSIHVLVSATGLHKTGQALIPQSLNVDLNFEPASKPPYKISIQDVQANFEKSNVKATGSILAAANIKESHANIHLAITNIKEFMDEAQNIVPGKTYAALTFARFLSHNDTPHVKGWDIILENAKISINGIPIPYGL